MDNLILERAQSAMLSRDYGLAARLYKTLLKTESGNLDILNALGSLYVKSGEDEKAIPYYENILTLSPHDVNAMNSLGGIYRRLKDYEKGIQVLERALDENQKTAMINYTLGFTYKDMGNLDDAIECFENVVSDNPTDVLAYNHLGSIYATKKNYPKAVQAYRRGLQTDPNHPILHYNLGHAYEAERNYAEAINCYELALKAKPGWIDAIRDVVQLLLKIQNTKRAMEIVQKSVQLYPANADLISLSGNVQLKRYDFSAAQTVFEKADRLKPNDPSILLRLAECLEKKFEPGEAVNYVKEARVLGFTDNAQKKRYAHVMLSAGELERAKEVIEELIADAPSDAGALDLQAQLSILNDDETGKTKDFNRIAEMNPRYRHHYLEAARRYCQIKDFENAKKYADAYIEKAPLNPAGYNTLGRIYEKIDDLENAVKTYQIAANLKYEDVYAKLELKRLGKEWNANLQIDVSDYINQLNEAEKEEEARRIIEEEQAAAELEAQMAEKDTQEFDFDVMGVEESDEHVVPLAELSEDEGFSGLDEIDDDTNKAMEGEKENNKEPFDFMSDINDKKPEPEPEPEPETPKTPAAPAKTEPADLDDFLTDEESLSADDAMEMLREDTEEPRMDSRLVDKIDDAVENLEKAVNDATEKAEQALQKAEEAASRVSDQLEEIPQLSDPTFGGLGMDFAPNDTMVGPEPNKQLGGFDEPAFDAPFEMKDPFDMPVGQPDYSPVMQSPVESQTVQAPIEVAFQNARQFLPNIVRIIEDEKCSEYYKQELGLFSKLRSLSDYLPANKKEEFLSSKTRMLMDYVIGKMSGKPGLAKTVENLLKSGILETDVTYSEIEAEAETLSETELAKKVINDLRNLTADLPDQKLAEALRNTADEVLGKL